MSSTELFRKHFGDSVGHVNTNHRNMEAFLAELNEECLQEDLNKKLRKISTDYINAAKEQAEWWEADSLFHKNSSDEYRFDHNALSKFLINFYAFAESSLRREEEEVKEETSK